SRPTTLLRLSRLITDPSPSSIPSTAPRMKKRQAVCTISSVEVQKAYNCPVFNSSAFARQETISPKATVRRMNVIERRMEFPPNPEPGIGTVLAGIPKSAYNFDVPFRLIQPCDPVTAKTRRLELHDPKLDGLSPGGRQ